MIQQEIKVILLTLFDDNFLRHQQIKVILWTLSDYNFSRHPVIFVIMGIEGIKIFLINV